jgi:hypothetical protein
MAQLRSQSLGRNDRFERRLIEHAVTVFDEN